MEHKRDFCGHCQKPFVKCGTCGNHCCNGTAGCPNCYSAYNMQNCSDPPSFDDSYKTKKIKDSKNFLDKIFKEV